MRVLAMIAAAAIAAAVACYSPAVQDCQFSCGPSNTCPDGFTCTSGLCRTNGATGNCPTDANSSQCAQLTDCGTAVVISAPSDCAAACSVLRTWTAADSDCGNAAPAGTWRLALVDSLVKLEAAPTSGGASFWVGAARPPGGSAFRWTANNNVVAAEEWDSGFPTATTGANCVVAVPTGSGNRLQNQDCTLAPARYLCDHP